MRAPLMLGLVGHNINYSMSPSIFRVIFQKAGVSGEFDLVSVSAEELPTIVKLLQKRGFAGVSVTIPHKQAIMQFLGRLDKTAKASEAVNCIRFVQGETIGFNTDGYGFSIALRLAGVGGELHDVLVMGSGGAARAVVCALSQDFCVPRCVVASRTSERSTELFKRIEAATGMSISALSMEEALRDQVYDLVINCTPLGGWNHPEALPFLESLVVPFSKLYFDLNYDMPNAAIMRAREIGIRACDGSMMLVAQAVKAFSIFTGAEVDVEPVYEAVFGQERVERGW